MAQIIITGASDDLIEIEGDITDEFMWYPDDDTSRAFIAVSDGTLLAVRYDEDGLWRFTVLCAGSSTIERIEGSVTADTNDVVTLTSIVPCEWVTFGTQKAQPKGKPVSHKEQGATSDD